MSHNWNTLSKQDRARLLKSVGLPSGLSQLSWQGLQKSERAKIEKLSATKGEPKTHKKPVTKPKPDGTKGKGWHEKQEEVHTEKGIEKKAPIHRQVALEKEASEANNIPMQKPETTHEEPKKQIPEPTGYFTLKKAQNLLRENWSELADTKLQEKSIQLRDYIQFIEMPDEYSRKTLVKGGYYAGVIDQYVTGVVPVDPWLYSNLKTALEEVYKEKHRRKEKKRCG